MDSTIFRMRDFDNEQDWLDARPRYGEGASQAATYCNKNKYMSQSELWEVEVGLRPRFTGNEATERGKKLEPVVRDRFMQKHGWLFDLEYHPYGMYYRTDYPMLYATLDGILIAKSNGTINFGGGATLSVKKGEKVILEIKNPSPRDMETYKSWCYAYPEEYRYQAAQQMFCSDVHKHLLVANMTGMFQKGDVDEKYFVTSDEDLSEITKEIKVTAPRFWDCVQKKERPVVAVELPAVAKKEAPSIVILDTKITVGSLFSNYAEVKKSIEDFASQYKNLAVTKENLPQMKEISAMLTKKADGFNSQRIGIGKQWDEPLVQFKALVDGLIKTIKEVNDPIKEAIKQIEDDGKAQKEQLVKELIEKTIKDEYPNLLRIMSSTGGLEIDKKWLNKSTGWNEIKEGIKSRMDSIQTEWQMLYAFKETVDSHTWSAIFAEYLKSKRNVQSAIAVKESLQKAKELEEPKSVPQKPVEQAEPPESTAEAKTAITKVVEFSHTDPNEFIELIKYLKSHGFSCREVK